MWQGHMFRESTKQGNGKVARQMPQWKALICALPNPGAMERVRALRGTSFHERQLIRVSCSYFPLDTRAVAVTMSECLCILMHKYSP